MSKSISKELKPIAYDNFGLSNSSMPASVEQNSSFQENNEGVSEHLD
jgi:hypothetical protein